MFSERAVRARARLVWRLLSAALACCGVAAVSTSCSLQTHAEKRQAAENRWKEVRAGIKFQLARQQYEQGEVEAALGSVQEAIALNERAPEPFLLLARCHIEQGRLVAARDATDQAARRGLQPAETSYTYGLLAEAEHDLEAAATYYRSAREQDTKILDYLVAEAECLVALGRLDEAAALVEENRGRFDAAATMEVLRAEIAQLMGDKERALESLRAAAEVLADDDRIAEQLGRLLESMGRYEEAVTVLTPLVRSRGESASPSTVAALAASLLAIGKAAEATTWGREWVRRRPDDPSGWTLLARAALMGEDWATARRCASRVEKLAPGGSLAHLLRGYACWRERDLDGAKAALDQALAVDDQDPLVLDLLHRVAASGAEVARLEAAAGPNS